MNYVEEDTLARGDLAIGLEQLQFDADHHWRKYDITS
jgi:hypothetical protein